MKMIFLFFVVTFIFPVAYQSDSDMKLSVHGSSLSVNEQALPPQLSELCDISRVVDCEVALVFDYRVCPTLPSSFGGLVIRISTIDTTLVVPVQMYCDPEQTTNPMIFYFDHGCRPWTWTVSFSNNESGPTRGTILP